MEKKGFFFGVWFLVFCFGVFLCVISGISFEKDKFLFGHILACDPIFVYIFDIIPNSK